jgi:hypothetical protein
MFEIEAREGYPQNGMIAYSSVRFRHTLMWGGGDWNIGVEAEESFVRAYEIFSFSRAHPRGTDGAET